jgi:hypothetical protein
MPASHASAKIVIARGDNAGSAVANDETWSMQRADEEEGAERAFEGNWLAGLPSMLWLECLKNRMSGPARPHDARDEIQGSRGSAKYDYEEKRRCWSFRAQGVHATHSARSGRFRVNVERFA